MGRKLRIQYAGAIYHVMNRGDHQERIFCDEDDGRRFVRTLAEGCEKTQWQVHAFCLMPNHFHLVLETPLPNLVDGMKWFLGVYTRRFNLRHKCVGHLFSGRYKALPVDGSGNGYLKSVCDYVHLNPVRAELLVPEEPLANYRWSSYPLYTAEPSRRPSWLRVDRLLGEWGIRWEQPGAGRRFAVAMETRRQAELDQEFKPVSKDWCVGSEEFRAELLQHVEEHRGKWHYGDELGQSAQAKAERLIAEELRAEGAGEKQLASWRKGHFIKVKLAIRLRKETTMTLEWISERLKMGTRGHLAHLLYLHQHAGCHPSPPEPPRLGI